MELSQAENHNSDQLFWQKIQHTTRKFYRPGQFVTFPGWEWSGGNTGRGGDRNVLFKKEGGIIRYGGLTCILAERLDRRSVWQAYQSRRVYATTGGRIFLDVKTSAGDEMGSIVKLDRHSLPTLEWPAASRAMTTRWATSLASINEMFEVAGEVLSGSCSRAGPRRIDVSGTRKILILMSRSRGC